MTPKEFFNTFGHIAEAPEGVKKLRELILQLAVQGKLVPQDPNDEPAKLLLKKIKLEKMRLESEGKIRKEKAFTSKLEIEPFAIPENWAWSLLGEFVYIEMGQSPDSNSYNEKGDGLPFYQGKTDFGAIYPIPRKWCNSPTKIAKKGDVVISVRAPVGPTNIIIEETCIGRGLAALRVMAGADKFYLMYSLRAFEQKIAYLGVGSTFVAISRSDLDYFLLPIPPASEQKRIVARVDELMALCDELEEKQKKRDAARARFNASALHELLEASDPETFSANWRRIRQNFDLLYDHPETIPKLRAAILQLAVQGKLVPQDPNDEPAIKLLNEIINRKKRFLKEGNTKTEKLLADITPDEVSYNLPSSWEWVRLGELGTSQTGTTPPSKDMENFGSYIPFIGPGNIKNWSIDYSGEGLSEKGLLKGRLIPKNSVLMVCIGGSIGKHAINNRDVTCNQQINTITPYDPIQVKYIFCAMAAETFQMLVLGQSSGSATPIINKQKWMSIPIPLPPIAEQKRIVAKVDQLMALCDKLEASLAASRQTAQKLASAVVGKKTPDWNRIEAATPIATTIATFMPAPVQASDAPRKRHAGHDMYNRAALCAYIVKSCNEPRYPTIGRVKLAKLFYLAQSLTEIHLTQHFEKEAAGPLDLDFPKFLSRASKQGWLTLDKTPGGYQPISPGPKIEEAMPQAVKILQEKKAEVDEMLSVMKTWKTPTLERWATVLEAAKELHEASLPVTIANVKGVLTNNKKWRPKLDREEFSDDHIEHTIDGLKRYGFLN